MLVLAVAKQVVNSANEGLKETVNSLEIRDPLSNGRLDIDVLVLPFDRDTGNGFVESDEEGVDVLEALTGVEVEGDPVERFDEPLKGVAKRAR